MNKDTRIQKIAEIVERDKDKPYGKMDIPWEDKLEPMSVYKIPLEYLIYNKYNGRILSRTKSLERTHHLIDAETEDGKKQIEKLLYDSNPSRNKQTFESIEKMGQEKVGIITRDGIIIDGNRRVMLLRRSKKYDYFKTVVLNVTLEENPIEIEKLETTFQMGEDEKLGYNATEKYIKAKNLKSHGVTPDKIAQWMGEQLSTVNDYLDVMKTMDDYLEYLGYDGIYTQLDDREDQFINLTKWLKSFRGEQSGKAFDGYTETDVDDLEMLSFDYIRIKYEGKEFRNIADGLKDKHFFGDKTIWKSFKDYHFTHVEPIKDAEEKIEFDAENLQAYLNARDNQFFEASKDEQGNSFFIDNMLRHRQLVQNKKYSNQPFKLAGSALDTLDAIDQKHRAFSDPDVMIKIEEIHEKTGIMLKDKSPNRLISQVIKILDSINIEGCKDIKEEIINQLKSVGKKAYQLEKGLQDL